MLSILAVEVRPKLPFRDVAAGLPQDRKHSAAVKLLVRRHGQCLAVATEEAPQLHVAAPLSDGHEAEAVEHCNDLGAG